MEDLASRFAALKLPRHHQKLTKAINFERLQEPVCYGTVNRSGWEAGQSFYGFRNGSFLGWTKSVYECQFVKPTQAQVKSHVEVRARVLQRQQNRLFQTGICHFKQMVLIIISTGWVVVW